VLSEGGAAGLPPRHRAATFRVRLSVAPRPTFRAAYVDRMDQVWPRPLSIARSSGVVAIRISQPIFRVFFRGRIVRRNTLTVDATSRASLSTVPQIDMDRINNNRQSRFYIESDSDSSDTDAANGTRAARSRRAEPQADDVFGALRRRSAHTDLSALVQSAPRRGNRLPAQRAAAQRPAQTAVRQRPQRMSELDAFRAPLLVSDNACVKGFAEGVQALHHNPPDAEQFLQRADALLQDITVAHRIGLISYDAANKLTDDLQVQVVHRGSGADRQAAP
jgi:hypothetical protein